MASNIIRSTYLLGFLVAISGTMTLALPADIPEYEELPKSCESLQGDICQGLGYKETIFPNLLNHESQEEAITDMKKYTPLIEGQCSDVLREFLCALYMPVCTNYGFHLPPCRALCRQVRSGCEEMMEAIGLPWPDKFDCTRFPEHHELMCVMSLSSAVAPRTSTARPSTLIWRGNGFMGPSLTQCVSNADCIFERSVCRAGECVCEYPRTWGPYGCEETQILGGQCSTDEQCSAVTPNAVCSDSVCTCRTPMISYMNLACIHGERRYNEV
ncbi:frizzled-2-like isoform X4 [Macrobrachium nipponense]|uniref:frizzled-2-like isoform X4 n=1 Tax=Macrobrachium nipponense TaxID=159736 RepID=UPI0030C820D8